MPCMYKSQGSIQPKTMNLWLQEWLRQNDDVSQREYVGQGFMLMKEWIVVNTDNNLENALIKVYDSDGNVVAELTATDWSPFSPFQKKFKVVGNNLRREDWVEVFTRSVDYLMNLLKPILSAAIAVAGGGCGAGKLALEWASNQLK